MVVDYEIGGTVELKAHPTLDVGWMEKKHVVAVVDFDVRRRARLMDYLFFDNNLE